METSWHTSIDDIMTSGLLSSPWSQFMSREREVKKELLPVTIYHLLPSSSVSLPQLPSLLLHSSSFLLPLSSPPSLYQFTPSGMSASLPWHRISLSSSSSFSYFLLYILLVLVLNLSGSLRSFHLHYTDREHLRVCRTRTLTEVFENWLSCLPIIVLLLLPLLPPRPSLHQHPSAAEPALPSIARAIVISSTWERHCPLHDGRH